MGFIAAYRSEFSHFIPQIHLLFSSSVRHCICNSFLSPSLIQPFILACHSKYLSHPKPSFQMIIPLSLSSSVLVFRVDLKGVTDMPSEKAWQRSQKILYQTETLVHAHKHTSAERSSFFVIPTKLIQPKSL